MTKEKLKELIKNPDVILLLVYLASLPFYGLLNAPVGIGEIRNLYAPIDDLIPLVPSFILIYHTWFPFLLINALALYKTSRVEYRKYMMHLMVGQWVAYLTFIVFQTYVPRATGLGTSIFERLIAFTYSIDNSYAGFPSLHVLSTVAAMMAILRSNYKPLNKVIGIIYAMGINVSTVLVKQHVFWDLPAGLVYALVLFFPAVFLLKKVFPKYASQDLN